VHSEVPARSRVRRKSGAGAPLHPPTHLTIRLYDFNVWTEHKRIDKPSYMHRSPVRRGLVASPELWRWSGFRAYFLGETGRVSVNQWNVLKMKIQPPVA